MDNMFDVLYNNITSNQAPGLNAYEKSVFLTKGQDETMKNYFNPKSKGNNTQEGFDGSAKRQVDFSMLTTVATTSATSYTYSLVTGKTDKDGKPVYSRTEVTAPKSTYSYTEAYDSDGNVLKDEKDNVLYIRNEGIDVSDFGAPLFDMRENTKSVTLPSKLMYAINEMVEVTRNDKKILLQVVPVKFDEYSRLMCKPYKRPLKYQAWRLINNDVVNKADIVVGPSDTLTKYTIRYVRRPNPIIVSDLDGLTIEGKSTATECELDPILHEEILQRAVELAKIAWTNTGQDNLQAVMQAGQRSE
uniref:Uncharacterized protein n=1 Tax=CrAss-like virus sp. ctcfK29 TaxID=2826827 RepID=A0A8S5MJD0_9CAUD|nr:MAG TPA: hypothetical protein [CrAss-like virus sp. ctcfK29]